MIQTSMFKTVHRAITERARCVKHNLLDGVAFRTSYRGGMYSVHTEDGLEFRFPFNPYTSFFEIGGYLAEEAWRLEPGMWVLDAGGPRLDLIKMDIEGAEIEAVEGAGDVLERFRPRFSIASYHARD